MATGRTDVGWPVHRNGTTADVVAQVKELGDIVIVMNNKG
jgi:hypothetical protein